jgi:two-component system, NarL family, invasion response regulator UvrY
VIQSRELFSSRENQILQKLALGKRLTEIGEELHLSIKTVSAYRARILEKTGFKNNAELVRFALERGLIS